MFTQSIQSILPFLSFSTTEQDSGAKRPAFGTETRQKEGIKCFPTPEPLFRMTFHQEK